LTGVALGAAAITIGYALRDTPSATNDVAAELAAPPAVSTPDTTAEVAAVPTDLPTVAEAPVAAVSTLPTTTAAPTTTPPPTTTQRPTTTRPRTTAPAAPRTTTPRAVAVPPPVAALPPAAPVAGTTQQRIYAAARPYLGRGIPYRWGGKTMAGMDCSGLVWNVLKQVAPGTPYRNSLGLRLWATPISKANAVPGDLVFWLGHVGIYAGNNQVIDQGGPGSGANLRTIWPGYTFGRARI
jgi:cell wall-associated NlpC family hydrolase